MKPLSHPVLSQQAQDALAGKPFILSDRYTSEQWDEALWYARQGDMADLELMIEMDAAHARADSMARHDPAYREGHIDLDQWLGAAGRRAGCSREGCVMGKPENPPAFPLNAADHGYEPCFGMFLRDWFAGQTLAGMLGHPSSDYCPFGSPSDGRNDGVTKLASEAYRLADAMLAERGRQS